MLSNNPLRRPFPDRNFDREQVIGIGRVAVFVAVFLFLFRPFGYGHTENVFWVCLGYGVVTFLVGVSYHYVTDRWLNWKRSGDGWTLGKWILDCALLLALISLGNFVYYNALVGWSAFHPFVFLAVAGPTVLVGLFPIAFSGMGIQLRAEREYQRDAARLTLQSVTGPLSRTETPVTLGEVLTLLPADLLFCEARQNYVRVVFTDGDRTEEETIRATLTGVEGQLRTPNILRCHRSFLVNVNRVEAASGNAQGLRLTVAGWPETVPVSRSFVPELRRAVDGRP